MNNIILSGGLGNQMFQYALFLSLQKRGFDVKLDGSLYSILEMHNGIELEQVFGIPNIKTHYCYFHRLWIRFLIKYKPQSFFENDKLIFNEQILKNPKPYLYGYWQDQRYFKSVESDIRSIYTFNDIDDINLNIIKRIESCNSVSLHIRRGDYKNFGMTLLTDDYYKKAISIMQEKMDDIVYFVFSDDEDEANKILRETCSNYDIININKGKDSYKDMFLMSKCKHNIIANSSFSWWGAWLNTNQEKIIIAPAVWSERSPFFKPQLRDWILI